MLSAIDIYKELASFKDDRLRIHLIKSSVDEYVEVYCGDEELGENPIRVTLFPLRDVIKLFVETGGWSADGYIIEDSNGTLLCDIKDPYEVPPVRSESNSIYRLIANIIDWAE